MDKEKVTPYRTSSGLEIGKFYVPPEKKSDQNYDSQLLQSALLETEKEIGRSPAVAFFLVFMVILIILEVYLIIT